MSYESRLMRMEEFNQVNGITRSFYIVLVDALCRDPVESIVVTAFWIWLSRVGFNNVLWKILILPRTLINELTNEAVLCIECINTGFITCDDPMKIPLIQSLLENGKKISLQYFTENRVKAMYGMGKAINEVCLRDLIDILDHALNRNTASTLMPSEMNSPAVNNSTVPSCGQAEYPAQPSHALNINTATTLMPSEMNSPAVNNSAVASCGQAGYPAQPDAKPPSNETPEVSRTMFMTFSKGYPVSEDEVGYFFTSTFGNCIEAIHMQGPGRAGQSLFARIVFYDPSLIDFILNGSVKLKSSINGKHIWMRKYVPRHP